MGRGTDALGKRIRAARGQTRAQLVLKGGVVVNVFTGQLQPADVAIQDGIVVGVGPGYAGRQEVDVSGKWVAPGFVDAHLHLESTMLAPAVLAQELLKHGTTTVVSDPHEIANVLGEKGIRLMLEEAEGTFLDIFFMLPSCVPATDLETAGARLGPASLKALKGDRRVLGLGEVMNYPGLLAGEESLLKKIELFQEDFIDGHCPGLTGYDLQAYLSTGIRSDHECTTAEEAVEKVAGGMMVMIREGSTARNLQDLIPLVAEYGSRRFCLVSDDLHAEHLQGKGHLEACLAKAVQWGLDPVTAIQLVTLNPAEQFGLTDRGAVSPGRRADLTVLDDMARFRVSAVYKDGTLLAEQGGWVGPETEPLATELKEWRACNMAPVDPDRFRIPRGEGRARVIQVVPDQITTRALQVSVAPGEEVVSDPDGDVLKLFVLERHRATGRVGCGLVKGFGLKRGAMASSVAHDAHNVIVVGVKDAEIARAAACVREMNGGLAVVCGDQTRARVVLEMAGLMSPEPLRSLGAQLERVRAAAGELGCCLPEPFMLLSFLALPVIPELRLTDQGLVDVNRCETVPLFTGGTREGNA